MNKLIPNAIKLNIATTALVFASCTQIQEIPLQEALTFEVDASSTVILTTKSSEVKQTLTFTSEDGSFSLPAAVEQTEYISELSPLTKSGPISDSDASEFSSFKVYGAVAGTELWSGGTTVSKSGDSWIPAVKKNLQTGASLDFFAHFPSTVPSSVNGFDPATTASNHNFSFTLPQQDSQVDFMLARMSADTNDGSPVSLYFTHPLTCVRFAAGTLEGIASINSISLSGVYSSGSCVVGQGTDTNENQICTYSWTPVFSPTTVSCQQQVASSDFDTMSNTYTFLLVPQTLSLSYPVYVSVEVTLVNGTDKILYCDIDSGDWGAGVITTYTLGYTRNFIYLKGTTNDPISEVSYTGGTIGVQVKSFNKVTNDPVAYSFLYCDPASDTTVTANWTPTVPSWLTTALPAGSGSTSFVAANGAAALQTPSTSTETMTSADLIKARAVVGTRYKSSSEYRDLSKYDVFQNPTTRNTANCYVVTAAGYYKFPVVYGNAIKDGVTNVSAYKVTPTAPNVLKCPRGTLPNHNDDPILDPNILTALGGDIYDYSAELIWQEYPGLIDYVFFDSYYLEDGLNFIKMAIDLDKSHIRDGNAVIALKKNGIIVWSWHIWICATGITTYEFETTEGESYYFMSPPLGTVCDSYSTSGATVYPERKVYVKAVATDGTKSNTVTLVQAAHYKNLSLASGRSTAPFYQWGRKDPMVPSDGDYTIGSGTGSLKTVYNISNDALSATACTANDFTMGTAIQNPIQFNYLSSNNNWMSTNYVNLWNVNNTGTDLKPNFTKSVYDPSPAGFRVPDVSALKVIVDNNPIWIPYSESQSGGRKTSNGFMLYSFGGRSRKNGDPYHDDTRYISCVPYGKDDYYSLLISERYAKLSEKGNFRASGYPLCPVQDQ